MRFSRFLAAGALVSLVLHGTGSAFLAEDPDEVSIAASEGGGVAVIGSIEDLVAGAKADSVSEIEPVEQIEPEQEPDDPVTEPVKVSAQPPGSAVKPVEITLVQPVADPVPLKTTSTAVAVPVAEGVTTTDPATAVRPVEAFPRQDPPAETARPLKSAEPQPDSNAVEIARVDPVGAAVPVKPVARELEVLQPIEDLLQDVTQAPRAKPEPPVRKVQPERAPDRKRKTAQKKGAETSTRKGGEQVTAKSARSNANGRKDATSRDGGTRATSNYKGKVVARLRRAKRYPRQARRNNLDGTAHVAFSISRNGSVSGIRLTRSSGHAVLDQAALDMVQRASPMPKFPAGISAANMTLQVPVRFDR